MKTKIILTVLMVFILLVLGGCVSKSDYDILLAEKQSSDTQLAQANIQIKELSDSLSKAQEVKKVGYFPNRTTIQNWLDITPKLGISANSEQWLQYALYYQQKAIEAGYIISVSYTIDDINISVTCDIITQDGWLYYFNPDDCQLSDTYIRVEMVNNEDLETQHIGSLQ